MNVKIELRAETLRRRVCLLKKISASLRLCANILCLAVILSGCVGGKQQLDITYYTLTTPAVAHAAEPKFGTLTVRDFYINPNYEEKNFNYRTGELTYETDFYNQFKLSPRVQFTVLTREALRNSGLFKAVAMPENLQAPDCVLNADVPEFYADFRDAHNSNATLTVNFSLSANPKKGLERPVLLAKSYTENVPIPRRTADDVARAWNTAFDRAVNRFIQDLSATPPPPAETDSGGVE